MKVELQDPKGPSPDANRQHGGPVRRGRRYIVGEAGPEIFEPSQNGRIIPSGASLAMAGGGGNTYVINAPNYVGTVPDLMRVVRQEVERWGRNNTGSFFPQ